MPADRETVLKFPGKGIHVSGEFQQQPEGTTVDAQNVRSRETIAGRSRGGSRLGTIDYAGRLPGWTQGPIQMLNLIVDPTTAALQQNFDSPTSEWTENPRVPGQYVPPGGTGYQPNPNADTPAPPSTALAFEQSDVEGFDNPLGSPEAPDYTSTPGVNSISLVFVVTTDTGTGATVTVTDTSLNAYTQVGTYQRFTKVGKQVTLSAWKKTVTSGLSDKTLKITSSAPANGTLVAGLMNLSGQNIATPLGTESEQQTNGAAMSAGAITVPTTGDAIVVAFAAAFSPDTVTPSAGYTLQIDHNDGTLDSTDIQLYVLYKLNCTAPSETPTATFAGGADDYAAIGFAVKD